MSLPAFLPEPRTRGEIVNAVRADLAAHPGSTSRDVADRCGITPVQASRALGNLRDVRREVHSVTVPGGGYRWALVGALIDAAPRPTLATETRAREAGVRQKRYARERRKVALLMHLMGRPMSQPELAARLHWPVRRVEHLLHLLAHEGRAVNREARGVAGRWVAL
jgi:hypothetical protein